jgi:hypothetical protein
MKEIPDPVGNGLIDSPPVPQAAPAPQFGKAELATAPGCICPPGANLTCQAIACPRRAPLGVGLFR